MMHVDDQSKWPCEAQREEAKRTHDKAAEFIYRVNDATMASGNLALKATILINGGSVVSLLTFIGSLPSSQRNALTAALTWFAAGVALGGFGFLFAYLTNYLTVWHAGSRTPTWQHPYFQDNAITPTLSLLKSCFHIAALVAGIGSLVLFVIGVAQINAGLGHL